MRRIVAKASEQQVKPCGERDGWLELPLLLPHARAEGSAARVERHLGERPTVQRSALYVRGRNVLHEVVEKLVGSGLLGGERRMAEHARSVERKCRSQTDRAGRHRDQSVYRVIVLSSRRFSSR